MGKKIAKKLGTGKEFHYFLYDYYGKYEGYDISIKYDGASLIYNMIFAVKGKDNIDKLNDILQKIDKHAVARYHVNTLTITNYCYSLKELPNKVNKILDEIVNYLKNNKYKNLCRKCYEINDTNLVNVDENISFYCDICYNETIRKHEKELVEKKNLKENKLSGIIGSIIGCLPGFVLWIILSYLMISPTVLALIIMLGSAYGYKWFAKSMKIPGLIISLIIGFSFVILANELYNSFILYNEYINQFNINIIDAYKAMPYYLTHSEAFRYSYNQSLFLSLLFGFFGSLSNFGLHRSYIASNKIKKIEVF